MRSESWFPLEDMKLDDVNVITELCGVDSSRFMSDFDDFFKYMAKPMIDNSHFYVKQLLHTGAKECAAVYDINPSRGERLFRRGALFYTGILAELSPLSKIPCDPEIFTDVANSDPHELIWAANERLSEDTPIFRSFMDDIALALDIQSPIDHHLAIAGAGLIHILTRSSLGLEDSRYLEQEHPELADMDAIFNEIENQ